MMSLQNWYGRMFDGAVCWYVRGGSGRVVVYSPVFSGCESGLFSVKLRDSLGCVLNGVQFFDREGRLVVEDRVLADTTLAETIHVRDAFTKETEHMLLSNLVREMETFIEDMYKSADKVYGDLARGSRQLMAAGLDGTEMMYSAVSSRSQMRESADAKKPMMEHFRDLLDGKVEFRHGVDERRIETFDDAVHGSTVLLSGHYRYDGGSGQGFASTMISGTMTNTFH